MMLAPSPPLMAKGYLNKRRKKPAETMREQDKLDARARAVVVVITHGRRTPALGREIVGLAAEYH